MAIDDEKSVMYIVDSETNQLYSLDLLATASGVSVVGNLGIDVADTPQGMDWDGCHKGLYYVVVDSWDETRVIYVDPTDASWTLAAWIGRQLLAVNVFDTACYNAATRVHAAAVALLLLALSLLF
eukprot:TRINITY_DN1691_c0_g1_i13.p2 TRINITY_DN1691_c0_g1~~TRINITY_DN1691_c0_g1_i13.p2  ORF type:complete len:125 (+),score=53.63 TRINITY_DN1691_c0_g1_i13:84-458(+)